MAAIAAEAGISKPILYRHFGDKSGLYQALAERHIRRLISDVRAEFLRKGDLRERTRASIDVYLSSISANLGLYRFLMHRATAEDQATHSAVSTVIRDMGRELADVLRAEAGFTDRTRAYIWGHAVVGMVHTAGDWWLDQPEVPRETVVQSLVDLILDGLPAAAETGSPAITTPSSYPPSR
jgi:AcrR family transcriptional regulator